jgi:hypothetical protein
MTDLEQGSGGMNDDLRIGTPLDDETMRRAGGLLRGAVPPMQFTAGFADRTMAAIAASRLSAPPAVIRVNAMQRSFRMLAAAAAVAILALGVHNTVIARVENTSLVEAAFGLQPVSATTILSYTSEVLQ